MSWDPKQGQIPPGTEFGEWLTKLTKQSRVIVESGPYYGLGTTACVKAGLISPEQKLISCEFAEDAVEACRILYRDEPRMIFLHSRLVDARDQLPEKIDLLILDGGDDDSAEEFYLLKDRCRWIALDDCVPPATKNLIPRGYCVQNQWRFLIDRPDSRLGWCIVENPNGS